MNKLIIPPKLNPGDKIAVISPSWGGPGVYPARYQVGKSRLESVFGLEVVEMPHALHPPEWVYHHPKERADDIMQAFLDPTIKGIFTSIGGDDAIRLLPYIDYDVIRQHPKIVLGFSDTTVLHFICLKAGIASFYGTSIMTGFAENVTMHDYTVSGIRQMLFHPEPIIEIPAPTHGWTKAFLDWGNPDNQGIARQMNPTIPWKFMGQKEIIARGHLLGGCVEVLQFINGTEIWPPLKTWDGCILFLETSEEGISPLALKRFLRNLAAQKILGNIAGMLFSKPGGIKILPDQFELYDQAIMDIFNEFSLPMIPIVTHMDFGHTDPMWVIPYGCTAEINPIARSITLSVS
ncbi:MAG: S66 peptidase family protein [Gammaproteobacteria bacterium]